jgi:hypothetical protein
MTGQKRLIINVENVHLFGDGDVINLMDNPSFLGEGSILDNRYIEKLELLEILIRKRRIFLQNFKRALL